MLTTKEVGRTSVLAKQSVPQSINFSLAMKLCHKMKSKRGACAFLGNHSEKSKTSSELMLFVRKIENENMLSDRSPYRAV